MTDRWISFVERTRTGHNCEVAIYVFDITGMRIGRISSQRGGKVKNAGMMLMMMMMIIPHCEL